MRLIRARDTAPELIVRRMVHRLGFRFRLHVPGLPGKPDLVFPRLSKIIEVRGCFWHQHQGCADAHVPLTHADYWGPKLARNVARDESNLRQLRKLGWRALVIWECETKSPARLQKRLNAFLVR